MTAATRNCGLRATPGLRRRGFTLTELMVAVAVMVLMAAMAGGFLVQTRRTIRMSQAIITANANVRAVSDRFRSDVSAATQDGFLAIVTREVRYKADPNDPGSRTLSRLVPHLVFTTVGTYRSLLDGTFADSARVDYSLTNLECTDNRGTPDDPSDDTISGVLFRRAILLDPNTPTANDHEKMALEYYRADPLGAMFPLVRFILSRYLAPAGGQYSFTYPDGTQEVFPGMTEPPILTVPPTTLAEVNGLWPYLIDEVAELKIQWTDGQEYAGRLRWYDKDSPRNPDWPNVMAVQQDMGQPGAPLPEFNIATDPRAPVPLYCALWTFKNKADWPKALRLQLTVGDPTRRYEVIVGLAK